MGMRREPRRSPGRLAGRGAGKRGVALIEFALILPVIIILAMATIDFGRLIQARLVVSNVSREGGSVASRETTINPGLVGLLQASGRPLDMAGSDGRIYLTRIAAGESRDAPAPTIATQLVGGSLGAGSRIAAGNPNLGLSQNLYNHLVFNTTNGASDISEITVVEVFYKYRPITPLPNFIQGMLLPDGDGMIVWSKAVF